MAKIWRNRLIAGTQQFENCPEKYRAEVKALLRSDVEKGVISADRYEEITGEKYMQSVTGRESWHGH